MHGLRSQFAPLHVANGSQADFDRVSRAIRPAPKNCLRSDYPPPPGYASGPERAGCALPIALAARKKTFWKADGVEHTIIDFFGDWYNPCVDGGHHMHRRGSE